MRKHFLFCVKNFLFHINNRCLFVYHMLREQANIKHGYISFFTVKPNCTVNTFDNLLTNLCQMVSRSWLGYMHQIRKVLCSVVNRCPVVKSVWALLL